MGIGIVIYCIIFLCIGVFSIFYVEYATMQILLIGAILPLVMLAILIRLRKNIEVEIVVKSPVAELSEKDKKAVGVVQLIVENTSKWLPLSRGRVRIFYENAFSGEKGRKNVDFSVDSNDTQRIDIPLTFHHCGNVHIQVNKVKIFDYIGIFSAKIGKKSHEQNIMVLLPPQEIDLDEEELIRAFNEECDSYSLYKKGEDPSEIFEVRDFVEGDKLQRIHWKLSYKKNTLMVKEFSLPLSNGAYIFVDMCSKKHGKERRKELDKLVQGVYSIAMNLIEKQIPQEIVWYQRADKLIRMEKVTKEEELLWTFQEMFSSESTQDENELSVAYDQFEHGMSQEMGLYLTVNEGANPEPRELRVKNLQVVNVAGVLHQGRIGGERN